MGGHMARHLSEERSVVAYDIDPTKVTAVDRAAPAATVREVGERAEIVFLSLPNSDLVRQVVLGEDGLLPVLKAGSVIIDTSTTEPTISQAIARALDAEGIHFMDAPVSGGEVAAREARLSIMVGGDEAVFERYRSLLETVGTSVVRVGDVGMGGVTKLVNNMIVGVTFAVIAEGFALGKANGIDPKTLYEAIKDGWAGSTVLGVAAPGIVERNFEPGGTINLLFKDMGYALSLARSQNCPVPMTAAADEIFKAARASGRGGKAQQIIIELWEELMGLDSND